MTEMAQIFTVASCMPNRRIIFNFELLGPYWGHVWAILGPCFGYFYNSFAFRCLKWLKYSLKSHACQVEEYYSMLNYLDHNQDHVWAILGPCFGYFYNIFASRCLKCLKFSLKSHACQIEQYFLCWQNATKLGPCWAILGPCFGYFYKFLLLNAWNTSKFLLKINHAKYENTL